MGQCFRHGNLHSQIDIPNATKIQILFNNQQFYISFGYSYVKHDLDKQKSILHPLKNKIISCSQEYSALDFISSFYLFMLP